MRLIDKDVTLKDIALELLQKYEESETSLIWEYSGDIDKSEKYLDAEVAKYRELIDKYTEQSGWEEMTVPCKHCGKDMTFKIATIGEPCEDCKYKSMAEQEPTIPCDLCGFKTDEFEFCEYLSDCPATGKAVSE